jgi:hypothetical protein
MANEVDSLALQQGEFSRNANFLSNKIFRAGTKFSYWFTCQSSRFRESIPNRANNPPKQYFLRPGNARLFAATTYGVRDPFGPVLEMQFRTRELTVYLMILQLIRTPAVPPVWLSHAPSCVCPEPTAAPKTIPAASTFSSHPAP